jgi:type II secretory ATPase GspE/PulE/Tfp pilus assembly ATPase PilB-like protein
MDELFEKILYRAISRKATDIHFYLKDNLKISMRRYGVLSLYDTLDDQLGSKLMNFIKYKSYINLNYKLLPQTGQFTYIIEKKYYFLRVSYLPSTDFESIVIRILNNHSKLSIEEITPIEEIKNFLYQLVKKRNGLFVVSGATGSGKSTTLYTLIDMFIKEGGLNIISIEDPIEMHKEGCLQIELNEKIGINYHDTLKQILRHDPDIIMIGEIRDEVTAKLCLTCALTGHLVLTTIHSSNAYLTLKRLMNLSFTSTDLEDVLIGILGQRLKYDRKHDKIIVLGELMNKKNIIDILQNKECHYTTFLENAKKLIDEKSLDKELFEVEFNE